MKILAALFSLIVLLPAAAQSATYRMTATVDPATVSGGGGGGPIIFDPNYSSYFPAMHTLISGDRSLTHTFSYDATAQVAFNSRQPNSFETHSLSVAGLSLNVADRTCSGFLACTTGYFGLGPSFSISDLRSDYVPLSSAMETSLLSDMGLVSDPADPYGAYVVLGWSTADYFGDTFAVPLPDLFDPATGSATASAGMHITVFNSVSGLTISMNLSDMTLTEITPAVPLPAGLPLLIGGLGGLAALRRRKVATA